MKHNDDLKPMGGERRRPTLRQEASRALTEAFEKTWLFLELLSMVLSYLLFFKQDGLEDV